MTAVRRTSRAGATLVEAITAVLVLGIAIPPIAGLLREVAAREPGRLHRTMGVLYAESLLEEIVSKSYEDPDEPAGSFGTEEGSRAQYDDLDDYDGYSESPLTRFDGTVLGDYPTFQRRVAVDNVTDANPDPTVPEPDGTTTLKRIRVQVSWFDGFVELTTLRSGGVAPPLPPLDVPASVAGAGDDGNRTFWVPLVSQANEDLVIQSFSIEAPNAWPPLNGLWLDGAMLWPTNNWLWFPTGTVDVTWRPEAVRTIPQGTSPLLFVRLLWGPGGTRDYTIVLNFTNGTSSTLEVPITW